MSTQHTPEPWQVERRSTCDRGDSFGIKVNGPPYWVIPPLNIEQANARRIVACVNACAGISDENLATITEMGGFDGMQSAFVDMLATVGRLRDVEQQRDELLAALIEAVCALEVCGKDFRATEIARQAIAKARGVKP